MKNILNSQIKNSVRFSKISQILSWAQAHSFWYLSVGGGCCADELWAAQSCRYDLERFGCIPEVDPRQADLLIVSGVVTKKAAPYLKELYEKMPSPKYVLALGACTNCGGIFGPQWSYSVLPGLESVLPVDIYVAGCPPRPEAIMNGLIRLQEKAREYHSIDQTH